MAEVKWIKLMVGAFDGSSFKKIKKATLKDGSSYRDKLTAVWFELLDLAGKKNLQGQLCNVDDLEIPFTSEAQFEDIAIMLDRNPEEIECCITWFVKNKMITIVDDIYTLSNWEKYQAEDKLTQIREQTRLRVANYRAQKKLRNVTCNGEVTLRNALDIDIEEDIDKELDIDKNINNTNMSVSDETNTKILAVFSTWNQCQSVIKHKEVTEVREKAIRKALKNYKVELIVEAIKHYDIVLSSKWYFKYKWSLEDFLNQKNAMPTFMDEGSNWYSFNEDLKKNPYLIPQPETQKKETPQALKDFISKIK